MQVADHDAGALYTPQRTTAASPFSSTADLVKWLWYPFPDDRVADSFHDLYGTWGIGSALQDLGISTYTTEHEVGKNNLLNIGH